MNTETEKAVCTICQEDSETLFQCCSNKADSLCESCWSHIISAVMAKGKIGLLFKGELPCECCHQPIKLEQLPTEIQKRVKNVLLTVPKTKTPKTIEEFNYSYNNSNVLLNCLTNEKFIFLSQRHYNLLGSCIDVYIQTLMKNQPWDYNEIWLPVKDENTDDHHDQVNIFTSNDFETNENGCLILIQGSGVVRPGQWARSCCINETLDIGSMFPYMTKAKEHNLSVIILNPNQTNYIDEQPPDNQENGVTHENDISSNNQDGVPAEGATSKPDSEENSFPDDDLIAYYLSSDPLPRRPTKKIPNLSTNREHVLYVYDHILSKCPAKQFYVVAHSAGGDSLMYLLRKRQDNIIPKLTKIAFTDSVHSTLPLETKEIKNLLKQNAIHFVASDEPMGEPIDYAYDFSQRPPACQEVSAGHPKHEYTSGYCVKGVFDFFFPPEQVDKTKL